MNRKLIAVVAMCATSLSTISTPANAAVTNIPSVSAADADGNTQAAMDSVCTAAAAVHDAADPVAEDEWTGTVVEGAVSWVSGPTEVGTHTFAANGVGTQTGAGTFTPAHKDILGDPYRNGGSVNMFGLQEAVGGHYSNSSYDFENDFSSTYAHAFSCDISEQVYHPAWTEHVPADPNGHYENHDFGHGNGHDNSGDGIQGSCLAHNNAGPTQFGQWGEDTEQCLFIGERAHDVEHEAYLGEDTFVVNEVQTAINQDQTDTLTAHETLGEGFDTSETLLIGQVVVCISPGPKGGAWKQQNGYTGTKCTTAWYNGGATAGVSNLNTTSHNWVTIPVV